MSAVRINDDKPRDKPNLKRLFGANRVSGSAIYVALYSREWHSSDSNLTTITPQNIIE